MISPLLYTNLFNLMYMIFFFFYSYYFSTGYLDMYYIPWVFVRCTFSMMYYNNGNCFCWNVRKKCHYNIRFLILLNVRSCLFTQLLDSKLFVMKEKKGRTKLCKNLFDRDLKYARSLLLLLRRKIENMIILSYREVGFTKYAKAKF